MKIILHTTAVNKGNGEIKKMSKDLDGRQIIDYDIVSGNTKKTRALEMVNEWNRVATTCGGDIFWHYHLELVP